jgi:alpha-ketoglutarate-dependent taurine dioxygenase
MDNVLPYIWAKDVNDTTQLKDIIIRDIAIILNRLKETGGILFKGYEIISESDLEGCVNNFPGISLNYTGGNSPRTRLQNKVYTSTNLPGEFFISLHNELSYADKWPRYIFFSCSKAATTGGNTTIADSRNILNDLKRSTADIFKAKGVKYVRNLNGGGGAGTTWQQTFDTSDKSLIEQYCKDSATEFQWMGDDLRLTQYRKAIIKHPDTGDEVWFNQADQFHPSTNAPDIYETLMDFYGDDPESLPQYASFGDGSPIEDDILDEIRSVYEKNTILFQWEEGDLLILDNVLCAHGRTPFIGDRKILVSML